MHTRIWSAYPHNYIVNQDNNKFKYHTHDKWVPVTTTWHVCRLWMEQQPPIWRIAVDILNNESWTADKRWSSSLGFGLGANNSSPYTMAMLWNVHNCLGLWLPERWERDYIRRGFEKLVSSFKLNMLSVDTFYFTISVDVSQLPKHVGWKSYVCIICFVCASSWFFNSKKLFLYFDHTIYLNDFST